MKREILFRGKRVDNGEWVHGKGLQQCKDELGNEIVAIFTDIVKSAEKYIKKEGRYTLYYVPVKAETLGQYTGLKDKDGNKIFEGDILEYIGKREDNMNKVYRRKVVFHEGMFALLSKELPAYSALNYHCMKDGRSAWRVISNVHDNPELMKQAYGETNS